MHILRTAGVLAALCLALSLLALSLTTWPGHGVLVASVEALTEPVRHLQITRLPRY